MGITWREFLDGVVAKELRDATQRDATSQRRTKPPVRVVVPQAWWHPVVVNGAGSGLSFALYGGRVRLEQPTLVGSDQPMSLWQRVSRGDQWERSWRRLMATALKSRDAVRRLESSPFTIPYGMAYLR